jgi:hypothetical protein
MGTNTPCIRCGKIRIQSKSWEEEINGSPVTFTLNVCPDPACQKLVDAELKKHSDRIADIQAKSLKRRVTNRRNKKGKS